MARAAANIPSLTVLASRRKSARRLAREKEILLPSRAVCAGCAEPSQWKLASFYWRWTWPSGDRRGYKQFFDSNCVVGPFGRITHWDEETMTCAVCQEETRFPDQITVYATYYLPGQERQDGYVLYHPACFQGAEAEYLAHAVRLADRDAEAGGPPPRTKGNPWDSWKAQGIDPAK